MQLQRVARNGTRSVKIPCKHCSKFHFDVETYADLEAMAGTFICQFCADVLYPSFTDGLLTIYVPNAGPIQPCNERWLDSTGILARLCNR